MTDYELRVILALESIARSLEALAARDLELTRLRETTQRAGGR